MANILIVDDEENIRIAVDVVLSAKGHNVIQVEDGEKALESIKTNLPDIVVCDIEMPKMKGFDVLKQLKNDTTTATIPFIFLTGKTEMEYMAEAMELNVDDFLTKPFRAEDLLAAIEIQLKKKKK